MNRIEFYDHVASWSIHRRRLSETIRQLTELKLGMLNKERHDIKPTEAEIDREFELKKEQKRLEFIVRGLEDTLDTEVDRCEPIRQKQRETEQISNKT